jgi:hypothetical protein
MIGIPSGYLTGGIFLKFAKGGEFNSGTQFLLTNVSSTFMVFDFICKKLGDDLFRLCVFGGVGIHFHGGSGLVFS